MSTSFTLICWYLENTMVNNCPVISLFYYTSSHYRLLLLLRLWISLAISKEKTDLHAKAFTQTGITGSFRLILMWMWCFYRVSRLVHVWIDSKQTTVTMLMVMREHVTQFTRTEQVCGNGEEVIPGTDYRKVLVRRVSCWFCYIHSIYWQEEKHRISPVIK